MALQKIQLRPGIWREGTRYSNQGGWYDCDKIRFRSGLPEKMKGWVPNSTTGAGVAVSFIGTCRSLFSWSTLTGQNYIGLGTSSKFYVLYGSYYDITPIVRTVTLAANQISTVNGSNNIYIRDVDNGASAGDYVNISGASNVGGLVADTQINTGTTAPSALLATGRVISAVLNQELTTTGSPIETTALSTSVKVTWASNSLSVGNFVTITNITANVGGIPFANLNGTFQVKTIVSADVFTITSAVAASSAPAGNATGGAGAVLNVSDIMITVTGSAATSTTIGGGTPTLSYQLSTGLDTQSSGDGWGAGPYGWPETTTVTGVVIPAVGWGEAYNVQTISQALRLWSQDNYGEDLIINPRGGGIYYETLAQIAAGTRATNIVNVTGALSPPTVAQEVCVFGPASTAMAFACNPYASENQDPMTIRWSAARNPFDWQPRTDNISGEIRLSAGSVFVTKTETKQEIVLWTDTAVFSIRWVGFPDIFLADQIGNGTSIMGPNAKAVVDDRVYWMGATGFYGYSGRIEQIPCSVKDYIFSRLNLAQSDLVTCGTNLALGEVIWFYPSGTSTEVDSYVTYNYLENIWYYGSLARTAWLDFGVTGLPIATGADNVLYNHEVDYNDGSTNPPSPIEAYIESSPFEIGDGDSFAFVRQIYPDLTFDNSTVDQPTATFTITGYNYPGAPATSGPPSGFNPDTAPVTSVVNEMNQFTQQVSLRLRARSVSMKLSSTGSGVAWRIGVPRFELRTDGRR